VEGCRLTFEELLRKMAVLTTEGLSESLKLVPQLFSEHT
jgi:hypothetical protein